MTFYKLVTVKKDGSKESKDIEGIEEAHRAAKKEAAKDDVVAVYIKNAYGIEHIKHMS